MRIGLVTTSFPRFAGDIPGHFVLGFAQSLVARGHTVEVLAPMPHEPHFEGEPRFVGITVRWVRYAPRPLARTFYGAGVMDNLRRDPRALLGLGPFVVALLTEAERSAAHWDALVSHWALPSALVASAVQRRRPHLAVLHSADVFALERLPGGRFLSARIARGASALLCSSRALRERFLALLEPVSRVEVAARTHVCAMGIEPSPRLAPPPARSELVIASLGRLVPIKGLEHAIRAVAGLEHVTLRIAGEGPARASLERLAGELRAPVRFVGRKLGPEKHAFLADADLFVLPSVALASGRTEGMPTTVLEAMDHGLPVVASDTGGVRDVVRPGENGWLVRPGDPGALRDAFEAARAPSLRERLGIAARETARDYHWETLAPHLESLLISAR